MLLNGKTALHIYSNVAWVYATGDERSLLEPKSILWWAIGLYTSLVYSLFQKCTLYPVLFLRLAHAKLAEVRFLLMVEVPT